jgi:Na+-translocating ferredoxin:NAD+ oxidoreductase RNF subunit RnfB
MDMLKILYSFLSIAGLGIILGVGLAFAARAFSVKKDERIEGVEKILPGLNCGACGYAGCPSYAEAIITSGAPLTSCTAGGAEVAKALAAFMGVELSVSNERKVAQVHCTGGLETSVYKYDYRGIRDCNAAFSLYGGGKECPYGCLGLGSCIKVCPVDAISTTPDGLVRVDTRLCISCGKCIEICPTGVMRFVPESADYIVACRSRDKGAVTKKYCSVGCIGCKVCEKKSPEGGFVVENFLATIDYMKTGERKSAADACPSHCIVALNAVPNVTQEMDEEG